MGLEQKGFRVEGNSIAWGQWLELVNDSTKRSSIIFESAGSMASRKVMTTTPKEIVLEDGSVQPPLPDFDPLMKPKVTSPKAKLIELPVDPLEGEGEIDLNDRDLADELGKVAAIF